MNKGKSSKPKVKVMAASSWENIEQMQLDRRRRKPRKERKEHSNRS